VQADVESGVARVRGFYESEGHLDAVVDEPVYHWSADHTTADVLVKISEGPRYTFGEITFAGQSPFPRPKLIDALGVVLENGYTTQRANTMQHNLEYFFKSQGYYTAEVTAAGDPKKATPAPRNNRRVPVTFTIKSGALYHFDGVTSTGLDRLHPDFLQKRFGGLHGETYDPAKLDEKFREVLRTGLFNNLRVNTVALPDNTVRVDLAAEEAKAKEIGFSIGFSTYEGFILGTRLADRDLYGNGRPLSLDLDITSRSERGELLYVDPWWFDSANQLRARLYIETRDEVGYSKNEQGIRFDVTRKFNSHVETGVFVQIKNVDITETSIEQQFRGTTAYQIATLGFTQSLDFRDSPVNPSKGWIFATGLDGDAVAGSLAFGRATGRLTWFIPLFHRYLLALGARGGLILPVTDVPLDERFFNGGGTTVRSFQERTLGPRDKGNNPIGGIAYTVFNAEVEIPIKDALSGALFVDAGNVISQFSNAEPDDMRFAVGVGVRYKLPIGPIRLDVGFNPDPKRGEKWGAIQFSFGFAF
jgi:outer membrane protein assembly complex protein YaeT